MNGRGPRSAALGRAVRVVFALVLALVVQVPGRTDEPDADAWAAIARRARPSIVRIEWRPRGGRGEPIERHAIIVDPDGWLLMAGPRTRPGTLAATLADGRAMAARVQASDPATGLTLLRVPVYRLPALGIHATATRHPDGSPRPIPHRAPPGTPIMMVTAEGAISLSQIRANHRTRRIQDPLLGRPRALSCLDESSLSVIASDLGAPWLDAQGRVVGLLVGAEASPAPPAPKAPGKEGDEDKPPTFRPRIVASYAVPARVLEIVWPLLRRHAEVPRAMLGVRTRPLDEALASHVCPDCGGRVVTALAPDGPAAKAGVQVGDILRGIGGATFAPGTELADALLPYRPDDDVLLSLIRAGETTEVVVHLGHAP
jgi:S1-C subfamily serine protease